MKCHVVLMAGLGFEETRKRRDLGHDRIWKYFRIVELLDIRLGHTLLVVALEEDHRAVLRAFVRSLAIELGRIMRHGKEDLEQLAVGDLGGIIGYLDGFGVSGSTGLDG